MNLVKKIRLWLGWGPEAIITKLPGHVGRIERGVLQSGRGSISKTASIGLFFTSLSILVAWTPYIVFREFNTGAIILGLILFEIGVFIFIREERKKK